MILKGLFWPLRLASTAAFFSIATSISAQDIKPPLTLERALQAADAPHPDLQFFEADRDIALADRGFAAARNDALVILDGRLQGARSSIPGSEFRADNIVRLNARKNLLDFGRSENSVGAAQAVTDARERVLLEARDQRRIDIMARYFDVLLADLQYVVDNEFMTVAFLDFDKGRDNFDQKLIPKVTLSELESRFQNLLFKRNQTQVLQRLSRELLAEAMNQPGEPAANLEDPKLPGNDRPLPSYEMLTALLDQSPKIQTSKKLLEASRQRLEAVRAENNPSIDAEVEVGEFFNRKQQNRDTLRAGFLLTWPLYQGNRNSALIAREQAQFHKLQAEAERTKRATSQTLLKLLLEAEQLQRAGRNSARLQVEFRDLGVERARAQYEVELRTNLAESEAATIDAKLRQRSIEYQLALTLAKIEALIGQPLPKPAAK